MACTRRRISIRCFVLILTGARSRGSLLKPLKGQPLTREPQPGSRAGKFLSRKIRGSLLKPLKGQPLTREPQIARGKFSENSSIYLSLLPRPQFLDTKKLGMSCAFGLLLLVALAVPQKCISSDFLSGADSIDAAIAQLSVSLGEGRESHMDFRISCMRIHVSP